MKLLVINGPNLNMLGLREPDLYGKGTYADLENNIRAWAQELGVDVEIFQSNHEGVLVDKIQAAYGQVDAMVLNPAAYTHTSIAILDALKAVRIPSAEVHLTDIARRESFRHVSYAGMACEAHFIGLGFEGYHQAMIYMAEKYGNTI